MQMNTPPRSTIRLTRRGKLALVVTGAVVAGTAVAVPLLNHLDGGKDTKPKTLVIPEGWRASQVYDAIDKALAVPTGTTRMSIAKAGLRLPGDSGGNPEGFLFPATYPIAEGATPQSVLQSMVDTANKRFNGAPIAAGAQRNAMNIYQAVTIGSIVQAEAAGKADMGKVARVVFNRLTRGMPLQMDSTINYALNRNTLRTSMDDTRIDSPYNSYQRMGLPPTPIDNPGEDAVRAAINPPPGDWLFFVTVKPGDTRFTSDYAEHQRNVAEFNALQKSPAQPSRSPAQTAPQSPTRPQASPAQSQQAPAQPQQAQTASPR
ncbi:endolytic transglycosylase MltG [Streptomyces olivochromogenes]|uniref:endolytic transglycosylase MltG n=1 Tax=Streptomyces olivochromogenes TaxID=1963 RepID=UPI001F345804|nr:endolytic transglycosylase MltG [Streptomyces olivochromogenes]MCF3131450.1 endolytic transglycosylase MltG [Streptomyces olivochromogenes]